MARIEDGLMRPGCVTKIAAELQVGDVIVDSGDFPRSFYAGKIDRLAEVEDGITIIQGGYSYTRPVDHEFEVRA